MSLILQRARHIRYCFVGVMMILLDLFARPWALFFPLGVKLHGIARAPAIWLHSLSLLGRIALIPRVFQLWGWLQLIVGLLVFLALTSDHGLSAGYDPEGDPTPAGQGQFGSSRWQTEQEIDGNFTVRKIPGFGKAPCSEREASSIAPMKNRMGKFLRGVMSDDSKRWGRHWSRSAAPENLAGCRGYALPDYRHHPVRQVPASDRADNLATGAGRGVDDHLRYERRALRLYQPILGQIRLWSDISILHQRGGRACRLSPNHMVQIERMLSVRERKRQEPVFTFQ